MTPSLYGIGINDADYQVRATKCPFYETWKNMLSRCYGAAEHKRKPSYIGCSVHPDWHRFSGFKAWMEQQDWQGKHLDKDLLVIGNKVYGPDTCIFVSLDINNLLSEKPAKKSGLPYGVYFDKARGKYATHICRDSVITPLGRFTDVDEASRVYRTAKAEHIRVVAARQSNLRLRDALMQRADHLEPA